MKIGLVGQLTEKGQRDLNVLFGEDYTLFTVDKGVRLLDVDADWVVLFGDWILPHKRIKNAKK